MNKNQYGVCLEASLFAAGMVGVGVAVVVVVIAVVVV
jgi:hypothetical protein